MNVAFLFPIFLLAGGAPCSALQDDAGAEPLFEKLGSEDLEVREAAEEEIIQRITRKVKKGEGVGGFLQKLNSQSTLETNSKETRIRARKLFELLTGGRWEKMPEPPVGIGDIFNGTVAIGARGIAIFDSLLSEPEPGEGVFFDPHQNEWKELPQWRKLAAFQDHRELVPSALLGKKVYFWGGTDPDTSATPWKQDGFTLDLDTMKAEALPAVSLKVKAFPKLFVFQKKLLLWTTPDLFGKNDEKTAKKEGTYNQGVMFDPDKNKWEELLPTSPIPFRLHCITLTGPSLLVLYGGSNSQGKFLSDGAVLDVSKNSWEKIPSSPLSPRQGMAGAVGGEDLFIWGGHRPDGEIEENPFADGARYNFKTGKWTMLPKSVLSARTDASMIVVGGTVLIWGGRKEGYEQLSDGALFSLKRKQWVPLAEGPLTGRCQVQLLAQGNTIRFYGGYTQVKGGGEYPYVDADLKPRGAVFHWPVVR